MTGTAELPELPGWAWNVCADCGLPLWEGGTWSSDRPGVHTHGGAERCERAKGRMAELPIEFSLCHQALVEVREMLGIASATWSDEDWEDTDRLHGLLFAAQERLDAGLRGMRGYAAPSDTPVTLG